MHFEPFSAPKIFSHLTNLGERAGFNPLYDASDSRHSQDGELMTYQKIYALIKRVISRASGLPVSQIFADDKLSKFYTPAGLLGFASALNQEFSDNGTPIPPSGLTGTDTANAETVRDIANRIATLFGIA